MLRRVAPLDASITARYGGDEFVVASDLGLDWSGLTAQFSVSDTGLLAYAPGRDEYQEPADRLAWVDRNGSIEILPRR